jgi:supervillin
LKKIFRSVNENNIRNNYLSLLDIKSLNIECNKTDLENHSIKLYLMTSLFGKFEVKEILNPLRSDHLCPYPFHQLQLYEEKQPSLFLIDNNYELYIWQGWFESLLKDPKTQKPIVLKESDGANGSTKIRYTMSRRCAYETAINYWKAKHPNENKKFSGHVVYAGLEPVEFINLFPTWKIYENARNCNLNVKYLIEIIKLINKIKNKIID